jgi:hypothetical protein
MAADRNQWYAACGSKMPSATKRHRPPHDKSSWLRFDTELYLHEHKQNEQEMIRKRKEKKNIQSDQPAWKPGGASATP